ncbi:MAG: DUF4338 domain-containing protein [Rubrivivax sp.]|nr:DUF4338 domain-containing protein [Rubrivivax sp.]
MHVILDAPPDCETAAQSVPDEDWRLFRPEIGDGGTAYTRLRTLVKLPAEEAVHRLAEFAGKHDLETSPGLRAYVAALLLRDLIRIGWQIRVTGSHIHLRPQSSARPQERKEQIRQQLLYGRDNQLAEDSNKRFIYGLERPTRYSSCKPVTDLIADGRRLHEQLTHAAAVPEEQRAAALAQVCRPYLQLVSEERDEFTNIRLIDIWRYFRHSWSTRYRSSPGRNLFYLVRDAAQPNHPVVGISALGNTVMQLTPRDETLGWTMEGLLKVHREGLVGNEEVLAAFLARLREDYEQVYSDDLPLTHDIEADAHDDTLSRLVVIEQDESRNREDALRSDDENYVPRKEERLTEQELLAAALTPLFRGKRARALREILRAYRIIAAGRDLGLEGLARTDDGIWALGTVIKQLKKRYSATSMMEITVCGAVAPYNHLLGGKLVCLMMLSPRVVHDYRERYAGTVSIIASKMAGRPIVKEPSLVFLGTTSLYTDHSSQYNRVKLPRGSVQGLVDEVRYNQLGRTIGFGSPNLSAETESGLAAIAELVSGYRNVNFLFGEGQSPKLRQLREGFAALGLNQSNLLQHGSPRIVYGVHLARNASRVLLGIDAQPEYRLPMDRLGAEQEIADYWIGRWLTARLGHLPALHAVAGSTPLAERVSRLIPTRPDHDTTERPLPFSVMGGTATMSDDVREDDRIRFVRLLYRNEAAFADHVLVSRLRELNIKTNLEEVVRKVVRAGGSIVITGNAGDGKTHAIRLMEKELKDADVVTDASELSYEAILARWQAARESQRPFCIAINEGPLVDLVRQYRSTHPWLESIREQLLKLVSYQPLEQDFDEEGDSFKPSAGETFVIDLSHRQVLSDQLVGAMLAKLTEDTWYESCASCPANRDCAVTYNRRMLREETPRTRMVQILTSAGRRGRKVTFREALAFVSYCLFAGKSCEELRQAGTSEEVRYYWNAFEGEGAVFELLDAGLDPVKQTHARIDEDLWRGRITPEKFTGHAVMPIEQRNLDEISEQENREVSDEFAQLKRRWYFEHAEGHLLDFSEANARFARLQDTQKPMAIRLGDLIKQINAWWNRSAEPRDDALRLWTKLTYQPRGRTHAMVSGLIVNRMRLRLYRPQLSSVLRRAFGRQPVTHLLLASADDPRYARLVVDPELIDGLLQGSFSDGQTPTNRRLVQFNDALSQYGDRSPDVRTIEVLDPHSELRAAVVVDLVNRRYDSAN